MKSYWFVYFISIFLAGFLFAILLWFFNSESHINRSLVLSPLPDFLSRNKNAQASTLDIWQPSIESVRRSIFEKPEITAKSALIYDLTIQQALYEKNPKEELPMASLTKIMTAVVALENKRADDSYTVTWKNLVGEESMGLIQGEKLSLQELLYGLLLVSGNDAAEVLASNYSEGREAFVKAMNNKVISLGLHNTYFSNPSGLQGDGAQHTTAYDLLVFTNYALSRYPLFAKIVATPKHTIKKTAKHTEYYLENETNLLTSYPGVKGVKTGYTPEANLCLVTYLEYKEHKIIGVLLGSNNRREEMRQLLDYSLRSLGIDPPR